jgi:hypothetical protein
MYLPYIFWCKNTYKQKFYLISSQVHLFLNFSSVLSLINNVYPTSFNTYIKVSLTKDYI